MQIILALMVARNPAPFEHHIGIIVWNIPAAGF
jgi:hypothetical protein